MLVRWPFLFFLAAVAAPVFAQPSVSELQNNYSYTQPGLPNYGISPGSLFIIKGTNLATTTNTNEAFPLTTNLNGTSVSVTVNGVTTQPTLYYILPTQIGAVLPEGTPLGAGTLTVSNAGQTGLAVPIQVVQSDFGILTYNGAGFGPAYAFDTTYTPITATHPATPGQLILFWGTGVGPDPANDDKTQPQQANNLTSIDMQVLIGGVSAQVYYKGRSSYPGVDEVFAYVPSGVPMGCYDSVVMRSGSLTSNFGTIPVAPSGAGSCTDQIGISNGWQALIGKTSANVSYLSLVSETRQTATGTQTATGAQGQFKTDNSAQIYSELFSDGFISVGSCIVDQHSSAGPSTILTAGPNLTVSGPGGEQAAFTYTAGHNPPYSVSLPGTFIPSSGGTFTFNGAGGSGGQIGSFNVSVTLPPPVTWTNMAAASSITASQGFTVNWTGGTTGGLVLITGDSTGTAGLDVTFKCIAPAASGTFTIPAEVTLSMPNTTTSASLSLISLENPVSFAASGLDLGFAYGGIESTTALANYQVSPGSGPQLQGLTLAASQTTSGSAIQGTVTLSGAAPSGGVTVALSSSSTAASVPSSVTVPPGLFSANFTITAATVTSSQMATIAASYAGKSSQAVLTVNPQQPTFNGTYTGSYSGSASSGGQNVPISGSVTATISGGTITVTNPAPGMGTVATNGQVTFGVVLSGTTTCNFSGTLALMGASATGSGTFTCTSPTASGTWSINRQ
jgi:uncharacterized protein (TIGR03437 family)